jgi:protein-disulfide isomerase
MPYFAGVIGTLVGAIAMLVWQGGVGGPGRAGTERIVHEYLLAHPEVIPEAMTRLQDRESGKAIAADRAAIETPVGDAFAGNPRGDVTLVEYFDYNCGYCRASLPTIASLVAADPKLRVVYRELPVLAASSRDAARMSLAAAAQGKFRAFHDALYAAGPVSDATIAAAAAKAGVDVTRARAEFPRIDTMIRANLQIAQKLGMNGTPSWVIGDRVLSGAMPLAQLQEAVAAARGA